MYTKIIILLEKFPFQIAGHCYGFFLVKLTYMLETVVFMLGKKYSLVSKYHVFHHATLPILVWVVANFMPGGQATFFALVNSFVHVIVLGYFVTVTAFPHLKQYMTWWKSAFNWLHVRLMASYRSCLMERNYFQIGQFTIVIIHAAQLIFWNTCDYPMLLIYTIVVFGTTIFALYMASWL